jgi:acetyl esterase/lipase
MTLAFAQYLKSKKIKHPGNIVLISPWIDLTNSNQQVMAASKKDIYLPYEGLIRASKWYCQNNNPKHWKYSPIYGDMKDIGYISIFTSSGDCLSHDANKLDALLWRQKIDHHFSAVPGLFHDYAVFPIPEARPVWKYIASIINDK